MSARFGTAIAAIWTPKRIVVAVDGRHTPEDDRTAPDKIYAAGDVFFTMAGFSGNGDTSFEAARTVMAGLQGQGSFAKRVQDAAAEIEAPLQKAVQFIHDNRPADFKKFLTGKPALDIVFFARDGGEMVLSRVAFRAKRRGKSVALDIQRKDYPNPDTGIMSVERIVVGVGDPVVKAFLDGTSEQDALVYPEQVLKKFMALAIAADPELVGYPVSMVKLSADGATHTTIQAP